MIAEGSAPINDNNAVLFPSFDKRDVTRPPTILKRLDFSSSSSFPLKNQPNEALPQNPPIQSPEPVTETELLWETSLSMEQFTA